MPYSKRSNTEPRFSAGLLGVVALLGSSLDAFAYEQTTHAAMTREAMMQSQLSPETQDLLQRLGIADRQVSLGSSYLDISDSGTVVIRSNDPQGQYDTPGFGPSKIAEANKLSAFTPAIDSVPGWLMLGAIREDDVSFDGGAQENNPQDQPGGQTNRVLNHFYDPVNNLPLQISGIPLGARTPDWALNGPNSNDFTVLRAREAMWRALTLKTSPATGMMVDLSFAETTDIPSKEALRAAYWATTFRALGDLAHLLQDMAQPQHTRNDPHSGRFCGPLVCPGGHASFYEKYVDANVIGGLTFTLRERPIIGQTQNTTVDVLTGRVAYGGYPPPRFSDYRSYFVTATGASSVGGYGMANYSNQGFYSAGTNIGAVASFLYPSPPPAGSGLTDVTIPNGTVTTVTNTAGIPVTGVLVFKTGNVVDATNPSYTATAVRLSSHGLFDQFLLPVNQSQYTLNHYNYDDQMALQIPRAVAYSAGLLDFFFRGRMDISLPDEGVYGIVDHSKFAPPIAPTDAFNGFIGFNQIRLRLSNSTPAITTTPSGTSVPQDMSSGTLVAVLKFHRNGCYSDTLDGEITDQQQLPLCRTQQEEIVVSDPIKIPNVDQGSVPMSNANPSSAEFTFTFGNGNALPINAWDVVLQVVYRGQLGGESDAVVVATKDISEPTFVTTYNYTDHLFLAGSCYDPATVAATDTLWNQLNATCKSSSGALRYVTSTCVNIPLNVRLTSGNAAKTVTVAMEYSAAQDRRILPRRFSRFAVLGDLSAGGTTMTLGFNNAPLLLEGSGSQQPFYLNYQAEQQNQVSFTANTYEIVVSTLADTYIKSRGVNTWTGQAFIMDGATAAAATSTCPDSQLDPLQGPERYPQAATITGW